jgi:valyl-tRNA synthetase
VGHCYKCDTVIQPLLREQWFVSVKPLAKAAIKALAEGKIRFHPASKKKQLVQYLESLKDWNISRQIAWGIPIPAFQNVEDPDDWIYDERVSEEEIMLGDKTYRRDPDVFDTWFSSSSWPYATLDYPRGKDFKEFYPLSVMETGADILYPWVSRMIMLGLYETGQIPFEDVYLHGLIQDPHGQKMSKSKGNVVNPIAKVSQYGSDAFRMGIISDESAGNNRPYDESKLVGARNFANKLWNIARYIEDVVGEQAERGSAKPSSPADHWVLSKLQQTQEKIDRELDRYRFSEAYNSLYHFVWDDFADWYIEASKAAPNKPLLAYLLEQILLLAHPFAPFVTETIWQTLEWEKESVLASRIRSKIINGDDRLAEQFDELQAIISETRTILQALQLSDVSLYHTGEAFLRDNAEVIKRMARVQAVNEVRDGEGVHLTSTKYRCWLDIDRRTAQTYLKELEAKHDRQTEVIKQLEGRLANKSYVENAPHEIVEQTKRQLADAKSLLASIEAEQKRFGARAEA